MENNLVNNLLTIGILFGLAVIIYCKVKGVTIGELISDIMGAFKDE